MKKNNKEQSTLVSVIELLAIVAFIIVVLVFFPGTPIWNIVVLLLILTILIFVHEGGHFIVGKMCGVHIYEFALGMGPKVLEFKRKNDPTVYTLRAFPIGGFCAMAGEEAEDDKLLDKDKFMCNKSKLQRTFILCAGVFMNFVTAIVILFVMALIWGTTEQRSIVGNVVETSPAYKAGIRTGDEIVECNGKKISSWDKLTIVTNLKREKDELTYKIKKSNGGFVEYTITPGDYILVNNDYIEVTEENTKEKIIKDNNLYEKTETVKLIGISAPTERHKGFMNAIKYAFTKFGSIISTMMLILGSLFTGKLGLNALSGPVGMYTVVGTAASYGVANLLYLAAYLSVNLGVMNILPFPAFDGGRVLFVGIEAVTRKKVNPKVETMFHTIGFFLIIALMLYITFQDILRLF